MNFHAVIRSQSKQQNCPLTHPATATHPAGERERVRVLYERLLDRTSHVKVCGCVWEGIFGGQCRLPWPCSGCRHLWPSRGFCVCAHRRMRGAHTLWANWLCTHPRMRLPPSLFPTPLPCQQVWLSFARFEADPLPGPPEEEGGPPTVRPEEEGPAAATQRATRARSVYERAYRSLREGQAGAKEEAVMLLEAWRDFEAGCGGFAAPEAVAAAVAAVEKKMPQRVKRRRPVTTDNGTEVGGLSVCVWALEGVCVPCPAPVTLTNLHHHLPLYPARASRWAPKSITTMSSRRRPAQRPTSSCWKQHTAGRSSGWEGRRARMAKQAPGANTGGARGWCAHVWFAACCSQPRCGVSCKAGFPLCMVRAGHATTSGCCLLVLQPHRHDCQLTVQHDPVHAPLSGLGLGAA